MALRHKCRRQLLAGAALALCLLAPWGAGMASAAGPPILGDTWSSQVEARSARLSGEIDANGLLTSAYFEYVAKATYEAKGFTGASKVSLNAFGSGTGTIQVNFPPIAGLEPGTTYLYRLTATNSAGATVSPPAPPYRFFKTQLLGGDSVLADGRGWEMVSPVDKNGGEVAPPGTVAKGSLLQAAAQGGSVTYSSAASFAGGQGAPPASQYIATRSAGGWVTENLTVPIFSGSYDTLIGGSPYRLFSADLAHGLLLNGKGCRGEATSGCPVPNPVLPGTGAPAGYQNYYLLDVAGGGFEALLESPDIAGLGLDPGDFELKFAGASADLRQVIISSCARLNVAATDGCPGAQNLYRWSQGGSPVLINSAPGAVLATQSGAVSADGQRVYFYEGANLRLRDGAQLKQADDDAGGGEAFQLASADGSLAYFTKDGHIWRYRAATDTATDLTPSGGVLGVLGAGQDGSHLYYLSAAGLYLCTGAGTASSCDSSATKIAEDADPSNYPPAAGTSRASADGAELLFLATAPLTGYDNTDLGTGEPDSQVYLYDATGAGTLTCISCNPTNARPLGPSTIPGSVPNGQGAWATDSYKPRSLSANGRRVFFDSRDALALTDTNSNGSDAYEWEAQGEGDCARAGGCISLLSSGRDAGGAHFADASAGGADAFFLTGASLVKGDLGSIDLYDARIGGGFAEAPEPIPCEGDACQALPSEPNEPTLTTLLEGPGNPAAHYTRYRHRFKKPKKHGRHHRTPRSARGGRR